MGSIEQLFEFQNGSTTMANQFSDKLLKKTFENGGRSLCAFITAELINTKGNRRLVAPRIAELLACSDKARKEAADDLVEEMYQRLPKQHLPAVKTRKRPLLQFQKENAKMVAAHESIAEEVFKMSEAELLLVLSDEDRFAKLCRYLPKDEWRNAKRGVNVALGSLRNRVRMAEFEEQQNQQSAKAASFDRMVQALDAIKVGNKLLGDCTGADLLREAVKLEELAKDATAQSVFYRQLASIVGKTQTVREAEDRAGIVGLLTTTYKDAA